MFSSHDRLEFVDTGATESHNFKYTRLVEFVNNISCNPNLKTYLVGLFVTLVCLLIGLLGFFLWTDESDVSSFSGRPDTFKVSGKDDYDGTSVRTMIVTSENINEMKNCLGNVLISLNKSDLNQRAECNSGNASIGMKSKIRFLMVYSDFFRCLMQETDDCDSDFYSQRKTHKNEYKLKDLYFNYMMGSPDRIYEGRDLTCSFDEKIISELSEATLIVGIPFCSSHAFGKEIDKNNFDGTLQIFLNCAKKSNLLTDNYIMEFHMRCRNYLFTDSMLTKLKDRINFTTDFNLNFDNYVGKLEI